jgi:serine phosphatase RsbU (regulator of sigma subunit)
MDGFVGSKIPLHQGISGRVAALGKQILLHEGEPSPAGTQKERASLDAVLSVPLILSAGQAEGEDRVLGVMTMAGKPSGEIFTAGDAKLLSTIATQAAIAIHNSRLVEALREAERVRQEMEIAASIQRSLLPDQPPQIPGVELAGRCLPAANVGGDYYDFLTDDTGRLSLLIADVSGHSVGSALMMAMARSILRREMSLGKSPAAVLADTNTAMLADLTNASLFITVFCARYDPATRELTFANGGHNPPLLWRAAEKQIAELDSDGMIVGILNNVQYEERTVTLGPGDVLVLYTDGVIEARSPEGEQLGEDRLQALLTEYNALPPHALAEQVYEAVNQHMQGTAQQDDITLLVLKVQEES